MTDLWVGERIRHIPTQRLGRVTYVDRGDTLGIADPAKAQWPYCEVLWDDGSFAVVLASVGFSGEPVWGEFALP